MVNRSLWQVHACKRYDTKPITVVWEIVQDLRPSRSLHSRLVKWIDALLSFFVILISYLFPCFRAYISNTKVLIRPTTSIQ